MSLRSFWHAFFNTGSSLKQSHNIFTLKKEKENANFYSGKSKFMHLKSECQQESSKIRNKRQKCENPNLLKLWLSVVHIELLIDMWFISQIDFRFGGKWRY